MIIATFAILASGKAPKLETLFFVTSDCPIAKQFTPEIKRIMRDYQSSSGFIYVYEDEGFTMKQAEAHHNEYKIPGLIILDSQHKLGKQYKVTGVPTVIIRDQKGTVQYVGRIDDSYGSDFKWHPAKHKDLRNALSSLRDGKPVAFKRTIARTIHS
jgi:hypothetical protein